ncbi:hypothetical protein C8R43DRAFT_1169470 [Mycena crocata]|nr:hypothetical protein C8R43DRAFT_1169470 [Mycena crocata]
MTTQLPMFGFNTTAEEVATVLKGEIKVLITGTSLDGIGFETARVIVKYAGLVIITGRNDEKREQNNDSLFSALTFACRLKISEETLKKEAPLANIRTLLLDLSSMAAVRRSAATLNEYAEPIHVLINNAATGIAPFNLSADGLEMQIATNYIGPFLFTKLIAPKILAARTVEYTPRVVMVSSDAHSLLDAFGVDLEFFETPKAGKYPIYSPYQQAKSANILFALELSKRAKGALKAYSLHPGRLIDKDAVTKDIEGVAKWKTIPQGAATTIVAAFDPRLNGRSQRMLVQIPIVLITTY